MNAAMTKKVAVIRMVRDGWKIDDGKFIYHSSREVIRHLRELVDDCATEYTHYKIASGTYRSDSEFQIANI